MQPACPPAALCVVCNQKPESPFSLPCGHPVCGPCAKAGPPRTCGRCKKPVPPGAPLKKDDRLQRYLTQLELVEKVRGTLTEVAIRDLKTVSNLGEGSFGKVTLCEWNDREVACKTLMMREMSGTDVEDFRKEIEIMSRLRHENIVEFLGATLSPPFCIVTEYMPRGNVWELLRRRSRPLSLPELAKIALHVARAMAYLHSRDIIHRDLKSANILLDGELNAKICDFGLSRVKAEGQKMTRGVGSVCWSAPEMFGNKRYGLKIDVFAFGIVLWELITGSIPYLGMASATIMAHVLAGKRPQMQPATRAHPLAQLMAKCWAQEPGNRPDFTEVVSTIEGVAASAQPAAPPTSPCGPAPRPAAASAAADAPAAAERELEGARPGRRRGRPRGGREGRAGANRRKARCGRRPARPPRLRTPALAGAAPAASPSPSPSPAPGPIRVHAAAPAPAPAPMLANPAPAAPTPAPAAAPAPAPSPLRASAVAPFGAVPAFGARNALAAAAPAPLPLAPAATPSAAAPSVPSAAPPASPAIPSTAIPNGSPAASPPVPSPGAPPAASPLVAAAPGPAAAPSAGAGAPAPLARQASGASLPGESAKARRPASASPFFAPPAPPRAPSPARRRPGRPRRPRRRRDAGEARGTAKEAASAIAARVRQVQGEALERVAEERARLDAQARERERLARAQQTRPAPRPRPRPAPRRGRRRYLAERKEAAGRGTPAFVAPPPVTAARAAARADPSRLLEEIARSKQATAARAAHAAESAAKREAAAGAIAVASAGPEPCSRARRAPLRFRRGGRHGAGQPPRLRGGGAGRLEATERGGGSARGSRAGAEPEFEAEREAERECEAKEAEQGAGPEDELVLEENSGEQSAAPPLAEPEQAAAAAAASWGPAPAQRVEEAPRPPAGPLIAPWEEAALPRPREADPEAAAVASELEAEVNALLGGQGALELAPDLRLASLAGPARLEPEAALTLARGLYRLGTVTELRLPQCGLSLEAADALRKLLATPACALRAADLHGNLALGDGGAAILAAALATNRSLTRLDLGWCSIGSDGARALADGVRAARPEGEPALPLRGIDLRGNCIGEGGAAALLDAMHSAWTAGRRFLGADLLAQRAPPDGSPPAPDHLVQKLFEHLPRWQ
eukprot:tig00001336_g8230.t1